MKGIAVYQTSVSFVFLNLFLAFSRSPRPQMVMRILLRLKTTILLTEKYAIQP